MSTIAMSKVDTYVTSNLPGVSNSLFDIQKVGRESLASGVDSFSTSISSFNPGIGSYISSIGASSLVSAGRAVDSVTSSVFSASSNKISSTVSQINNAIADKVTTTAKGALSSTISTKDSLSDNETEIQAEDENESSNSKVGSTEFSKIPMPADASSNSTDLIYQECKLYIEGVQVPYESMSISQSLGQLPRATVQIPPQAGLMDIARFYEPKVHIFYTDNNTGGDRLLFWGHIVASNYAYSKQGGYATIAFECEHKNSLMEQVTFEWSGGGAGHATEGTNQTDGNPQESTIQMHNFNSYASMTLALQGITGMRTSEADTISPSNKNVIQADPTKLDTRFKDFEKRMIGMPSAIMNLWNQVKREVFANQKLNIIFSKMYLPLVEEGIAFFDRMSGHFLLENQIHNSRQKHCNDNDRPEMSKYDTLLPPAFRMDIMSAAHTQLVLNTLNSQLGFSNEQMNFYQLFTDFFYAIEYDMLTLASPAEIPVDPASLEDIDDDDNWRSQKRMAVETIVKPQLPFYYAPICNVILPNMFHTIQVNQAENTIPTRITVMNTALSAASNSPTSLGVNYRAPHSIREAVAIGKQLLNGGNGSEYGTLLDTTASSYNVPGKYELGKGVHHKKLMMPTWLSYFSSSSSAKRSSGDDEVYPTKDTVEDKNLSDLRLAWIDRYGYSDKPTEGQDKPIPERTKYKDSMNPYSRSKSKIMAFERMLFASVDYDFTKEVVKSKTGSVECIFNPYIVAGYPMDIIDRSPNNPSFHALCGSVTHSITSRSIGTSVSFVAAVTYTELSNYFLVPTHPWLQTALKMVNVNRDELKTEGSSVSEDETDVDDPPDKVKDEGVKTDTTKDKKMFAAELANQAKNTAADLGSTYGLSEDKSYDTNKGDVKYVFQTLIGNDRAAKVADQFYRGVLGVGAAYPNMMYDFEEGSAKALDRSDGKWMTGSIHHTPSPHGGEQNDNFTGVGNLRLIRRQIESKNSIEDKFGLKFIDMTPNNYNGAQASYTNEVLTNHSLLEPGASLFLDYEEITDFIKTSLKE
jgi:hypothetical protein